MVKSENDGGYTADYLAYKYGLSVQQAADIIRRVGLSRKALDRAAAELKIAETLKNGRGRAAE